MSFRNDSPDESSATSAPVWPAAGSTSYYALLHCSDAASASAHSTLELINTISQVLSNVSEPAVAEQKVHWWHEELARLANGNARHPASVAWHERMLANTGSLQPVKSLTQKWLAVLSCNANERFANATDDEAFRQRVEDDYSARLQLLAAAIATADNSSATMEKALSADIARGLGLCHRLRQFNHLQSAGVMVWPDSLYQKYELKPESLYDAASREQLMNLFRQVTDEAVESLLSGLSSQKTDNTVDNTDELENADTTILIASTLRLQQMKMWQKKRPDFLREYQGLTPFRKSLVTWRTRRRLAKQR